MGLPTSTSALARAALQRYRPQAVGVLDRYGATNLRMFSSVARGDAHEDSDLNLLVDLVPGRGNELLRLAGLAEELGDILGLRVDVVAATLLRDEVSSTALADASAVRRAPTNGTIRLAWIEAPEALSCERMRTSRDVRERYARTPTGGARCLAEHPIAHVSRPR